MKRHINNSNNFQHHWFHLHHYDTVIVVIMFHKSHNIRNCAFWWNSSSFCWHNFFSVNEKYWPEVDEQKFVENIRNGDHVFIPICSIVLKTQYSLWNHNIHMDFVRNILYKIRTFVVSKTFIYSTIYHGSYMFGVCSKTGRCHECTKKYVYLYI
jgi:hypothetical protein